MSERKAMVSKQKPLTVVKQCRLLNLARSTTYYRPAQPNDGDLDLMRRIDEIHLALPFYGSRRIRNELEDQGKSVNRKKIQRLMRQMGIRALYPRKRTSIPGKGHKIYPYRLNGLTIDRPNQVWATDITYLPMAKGFMYLVAIMDWHSRKVLSWRLSNSMDSHFCTEALQEALDRFGAPEIFNTDQGAQFTSTAFTDILRDNNITISMDGKGRWVDNVFVERLWRTVKYEDIYLKAYETPAELSYGLDQFFRFYNTRRRHTALGRKTPDTVYFNCSTMPIAA
jgi:putative transposase